MSAVVVSYALEEIFSGARTKLASELKSQVFDIGDSGRFTLICSPSDIKMTYLALIIPQWVRGTQEPSPNN